MHASITIYLLHETNEFKFQILKGSNTSFKSRYSIRSKFYSKEEQAWDNELRGTYSKLSKLIIVSQR